MHSYNIIRNHVGLVDLDNWFRFEISGIDAVEVLDETVGCNMHDLFEGRAANTLIPSLTGGVDAIIWIIARTDSFLVLGEPEDQEAVSNALEQTADGRDIQVKDIRKEKFALVLTGPKAENVAEQAFGDEIYSIAFLNALTIGSSTILAARIGFFGEYELHLFGDADDKEKVIDQLKEASGCGCELMAGQDDCAVMMIEMRVMSRHRDIPNDTSVFEAGLHWMIDFRKENLRGADALAERKNTMKQKCVMMLVDGDTADITDQSVFIDDVKIGTIHSVYWSDSLNKNVALAYIQSEFGYPGLSCTIGANHAVAETVSAPAFLSKSVLNSLNMG